MDEKDPDSAPARPVDAIGADDGGHADHDDLTTELVAYLDGELDRRTNEFIGTKISLDAGVRAEADALKKTWDLLDHLPRPEPSPSFTERTISKIEPLRQTGDAGSVAPTEKGTFSPLTLPTIIVRRSAGRRFAIFMVWLAGVLVAGSAGYLIRGQIVSGLSRMDQTEKDSKILSERRLLLNLRNYRYIDDLKFLEALDNPDLFGDEHAVTASEAPR